VSFDIKTVEPAEFAAWHDVMGTAYFLTSDVEAGARWRSGHTDFTRASAAYDAGRIVATLRTFANEITVPGGAIVAADAVTNVSTLPTHRRRGALTAMMTASLIAAVDRGDPLSMLIAAQWPIYGRYGYGAAIESAAYEIDATLADFGSSGREGAVDYVDRPTARELAPAVFDRFRRLQPGAIQRGDFNFDHEFGIVTPPGKTAWEGRAIVHRSKPDAEVDGLLRYHVEDKWDGMRPRGALVVDDLVTTTPAAYAALWRLCCEVDNVVTVKAADRSVDEALPWFLADARAVIQTARTDFVWLRLLDVAAALSARRYLTEGRVVLEVRDSMSHASGRYALEGGAQGATCVRATESAHLELDVTTSSSAYVGGVRLRSMAAAGLVTEHLTGALDLADAMFAAPATPWCNTWF
jgi:predicted acetyltransferase